MILLPPNTNNNRSEAAKAALLSAFVIPGAGQIYNGQWFKGIFLAIVFLIASVAFLIPVTVAVVGYYLAIGQGDTITAERALQSGLGMKYQLAVLFLVSLVLYLYSIVDSYRVGKKWESVPQNPLPPAQRTDSNGNSV